MKLQGLFLYRVRDLNRRRIPPAAGIYFKTGFHSGKPNPLRQSERKMVKKKGTVLNIK